MISTKCALIFTILTMNPLIFAMDKQPDPQKSMVKHLQNMEILAQAYGKIPANPDIKVIQEQEKPLRDLLLTVLYERGQYERHQSINCARDLAGWQGLIPKNIEKSQSSSNETNRNDEHTS